MTVAGTFSPDDKLAKTDTGLDAIRKADWFRLPYPGISADQLFNYLTTCPDHDSHLMRNNDIVYIEFDFQLLN